MLRTLLLIVGLAALLLSCCSSPVDIPRQKGDEATSGRWEFTFPSNEVRTLELRSEQALNARIIETDEGSTIRVSAKPVGGAAGYFPAAGMYEKPWKETKPADWGLGFQARRYGSRLVVSSVNEISYIHHYYALEDIEVVVPRGLRVRLIKRELNGHGAPDLRR